MIEFALMTLLAAAGGEYNWEQRRAVERFRLRLLGAPPVRFIPGERFNPEQPHSIEGISFDPQHGLVATGNNQNVNYMGFVIWMTPGEFLGLNPVRIGSWDWILGFMEEGGAMSPPMLYLDEIDERIGWEPGERRLAFEVRGHEGRGRMSAMQKLRPGSLVPVPVLVKHWRARDFTPEMLLGTTVAPDSRRSTSVGQVITKEDIHRKADEKGVIWDSDKPGSEAFLRMSMRLTGKAHLDDMSDPDLRQVYAELDGVPHQIQRITLDQVNSAQPAQGRQEQSDRGLRAAN